MKHCTGTTMAIFSFNIGVPNPTDRGPLLGCGLFGSGPMSGGPGHMRVCTGPPLLQVELHVRAHSLLHPLGLQATKAGGHCFRQNIGCWFVWTNTNWGEEIATQIGWNYYLTRFSGQHKALVYLIQQCRKLWYACDMLQVRTSLALKMLLSLVRKYLQANIQAHRALSIS